MTIFRGLAKVPALKPVPARGVPRNRRDELHEEFLEVLCDRPWLWKAFEDLALGRADDTDHPDGPGKYGANAILEVLRWNYRGEKGTRDYKVPSQISPFFARLFIVRHPHHLGFFQLNRQPSWRAATRHEYEVGPPYEYRKGDTGGHDETIPL